MKLGKTIIGFCVTAALTIPGACGHQSHDEHDHHHHEGEEGHSHSEVIHLADYSDRYEVYVEGTPLSKGNESHLLTHITLLENFKPLGEGKVTATLTVGGKQITQTVEAPHHPGIYEFELTPPAAGKASLTFDISTAQGEVRVAFGDLTVYPTEHDAHEAAEEANVHISNGATFTKAMSWKIDFSTEEALVRPFGQIIHATGKIEPSAGDVQTIIARTSGTVHFARPSLTEGGNVAAGETLFRINPEVTADGSMKVRVRQAENDYKSSREAYERGMKLKAEGLMTETELTQLRNAYENAEAYYRHLSGNFGVGGATTATSAIAGFVTSIDVANGQYVEAGQPLATVARNRDLFVRADIPVRYSKYLGGIASASLRPMNSDENIELPGGIGSVVSIGKGVAEGSQLIPVVFRMPNRAGMMPGEFVDMRIRTSGGSDALTVPSEALIEQQGAWFVYVQIHPEYFEKRSVKPGRTDGVNTEILSGLKEGERVVGKGAIMVKLAQASGALDAHAGHVH